MEVIGGDKQWSKHVKCRSCKNKLKITKGDLRVANHAVGYAGEPWEPEIEIDCPVCENSIIVTKDVPDNMRYRMFEDARQKRG